MNFTCRQLTKITTLVLVVLVSMTTGVALAQGDEDRIMTIEETVITEARSAIQNQIELKPNSTQIVDRLNTGEIGKLAALSIGKAFKKIADAASHFKNGGAIEISVRDLGPFLGTTAVNDREAIMPIPIM